MSSEPSSRGDAGPYKSMALDGRIPWQIAQGPGGLQSAHQLPYGQLQASAIDPQLSNSGRHSAQDSAANTDRAGSQSQASNHDSTGAANRFLPSKDVSDETLDDTYVSFILYCNPSVPVDTDTDELRKAFRSPPKSDGKSFSTFTLFELIRKLELKEIKTWAQLAIDLGVEPPAMEKGQSAQKVQQYAVRLKRWMHAMHVDAFFEYLIDKNHTYWTDIPSINDPLSEFGRDGVPPEEDLALRALLPETRPKRGRRRAEDKDSDVGRSPAQRPRLHSPTLSEEFAMARASGYENLTPSIPRSEWPVVDGRISFSGRPMISFPPEAPPSSQNQQWRGSDSNQTPITPYPQSAIIPRSTNPFLPYEGEPQSAITPSSSKSRRRHGPAVSSAWPSSSNFSAGKLRGRPPSNRSVSDGPFSTFPANPNMKTGPTINLRDSAIPGTPVVDDAEVRSSVFNFRDPLASNKAPATKPSKLYLQVPERIGGPVRLATPPPTLLLNGENETMQSAQIVGGDRQNSTPLMDYLPNASFSDRFDPDSLSRRETQISDTGQKSANQSFPDDFDFRNEPGQDRTNITKVELMFMHTVLCADWFDQSGQTIDKCSLEEADQIVKQVIRNLRNEANSKETFLVNLACLVGGEALRASKTFLKITRLGSEEKVSRFEANWTLKFGLVEWAFNRKIVIPRKDALFNQDLSTILDSEDWKKRYIELHTQLKDRDAVAQNLRNNVLEALVASDGFGFNASKGGRRLSPIKRQNEQITEQNFKK